MSDADKLPHAFLQVVADRADVDTDWLIAELMDWPNPKRRFMKAALDELDDVAAERDRLRAALADAVRIMHTARKSTYFEHSAALKRFDREHEEALEAVTRRAHQPKETQ